MTDSRDRVEKIIASIDAAYFKEREQKPRAYIGASIIGSPCEAMIEFQLRGFPDNPVPAKLKRIFNIGHMFEEIVVKDLKRAGLSVWEVDGLTGKQHSYNSHGGHVVCHTDGICEIDDEPHILEVKSMNDSSFKKFCVAGVKMSHPKYYAQMQMMMGMSGITKCLFIALSKNTQEYHAEIVDFDVFEWSFLRQKIETVMGGEARKISVDETDWRCRDCFKSGVCWDGKPPLEAVCRTCEHAKPTDKGGWHCSKHDRAATDVCSDYKLFHPKPKR